MKQRVGVFSLALVAVLAIASATSQAAQPLMTRHTRSAVVNGEARSLGRMPASQTMNFSVTLALRHAPELLNFLDDVYDPASSNYRHFLTPAQFAERFGPSHEDFDAVVQFAKASGFQVIFANREGRNVQLKGTVGAVEKAFQNGA